MKCLHSHWEKLSYSKDLELRANIYFREHVLFHCFSLANKTEYEVLYTRFLKFWECDHDWTKLTISETHCHRPFCIILIVLLIEKQMLFPKPVSQYYLSLQSFCHWTSYDDYKLLKLECLPQNQLQTHFCHISLFKSQYHTFFLQKGPIKILANTLTKKFIRTTHQFIST